MNAPRIAEGKVTAIPHPAFPSTTIFVPALEVPGALEILNGRFDFKKLPGEPPIRTLLDLAPHNGAFAAWAATRFPYAWLDLFEPDEDRRRLCILNAPPGARVHAGDLLEELRAESAARTSGNLKVSYELGADAVHLRASQAERETPIRWDTVRVAFVEHEDRFDRRFASAWLHDRGFDLVAADRGFTAWVRS